MNPHGGGLGALSVVQGLSIRRKRPQNTEKKVTRVHSGLILKTYWDYSRGIVKKTVGEVSLQKHTFLTWTLHLSVCPLTHLSFKETGCLKLKSEVWLISSKPKRVIRLFNGHPKVFLSPSSGNEINYTNTVNILIRLWTPTYWTTLLPQLLRRSPLRNWPLLKHIGFWVYWCLYTVWIVTVFTAKHSWKPKWGQTQSLRLVWILDRGDWQWLWLGLSSCCDSRDDRTQQAGTRDREITDINLLSRLWWDSSHYYRARPAWYFCHLSD